MFIKMQLRGLLHFLDYQVPFQTFWARAVPIHEMLLQCVRYIVSMSDRNGKQQEAEVEIESVGHVCLLNSC